MSLLLSSLELFLLSSLSCLALYCALLYSTLLYSTPFHSTLLCRACDILYCARFLYHSFPPKKLISFTTDIPIFEYFRIPQSEKTDSAPGTPDVPVNSSDNLLEALTPARRVPLSMRCKLVKKEPSSSFSSFSQEDSSRECNLMTVILYCIYCFECFFTFHFISILFLLSISSYSSSFPTCTFHTLRIEWQRQFFLLKFTFTYIKIFIYICTCILIYIRIHTYSHTYYNITHPQTPPHDVKDRDDNGRVFSMRLTEGCAGDVDMERRDSQNSSASKNKFMTPPSLVRKESDSREVRSILSSSWEIYLLNYLFPSFQCTI